MSFMKETLGQLLEKQADRFGDHDAIVYPEHQLRLTYRQFNDRVNSFAKGLLALGIKKGDHVAVWSDNKVEWLITQFATAKIGAVLVTVNTNYQAFELQYLLEQSDTNTLIMATHYKKTSYIEVLEKICPNLHSFDKGNVQCETLPYLKNIIMIDDSHYSFGYTFSEVEQLEQTISSIEWNKRTKELHYDDVINMQYTSGTTGFPKGVMLSHYNIMNNAKRIGDRMKLTEKDRLCIPVPFFHTFGCVLGILTAVVKGTTMVIVEQFHAEKVLQAVEEEKCTALHGVPTMFIAELNDPNFKQYDLSNLRTGIMAGSNCPIEVMQDVMEKMGIREITIAYGLTETSPVITQTTVDDPVELRVSTVGTIHPDIEAKIIDPETKEEVEPNVPGELITRGYHVMKGYYKNQTATEETIDENGWLYTGDLATVDENGYFSITGRMKDVIIRGGENIYPREIEEFLYRHPDIVDVQVIGIPDKKYGEVIMACVIKRETSKITEEEIRQFCIDNIAWHKVPKYIHFFNEYPMTASGKIQKFKLREVCMNLIDHQ